MNVPSRDMTNYANEAAEECECCVCDALFQPCDPFEFVCQDCKKKLSVKGCACGSDDIQIDWGVELSDDPAALPYYWEITCYCGREIKSRLHGVNEMSEVAKEIFAQWINTEAK